MHYILVVAHDRLTRSLIATQLKEEGFEVIGSATIKEAVFRLRESRLTPALLIIESPELDINEKPLSTATEQNRGVQMFDILCEG